MKGTEWVAALGGAIVGGAVGFLAGMAAIEGKVRREYEESSAAVRRAMEMARVPAEVEAPAATEAVLVHDVNVVNVTADLTRSSDDDEPIPNHYKTALAKAYDAKETPVEMFVEGGVNDYGVSYIEEEEFLEDDNGWFKGQITLVMDEFNPQFFMDGVQISDWDERLGDSIVVDFYKLVPPGVPQVLYVRNHRREEDYEVIREMP